MTKKSKTFLKMPPILFLSSLLLMQFSCKKSAEIVESVFGIETIEITEITSVSAISGGTIESNKVEEVIQKGVCWSIETKPTTDNFSTNDGNGYANFKTELVNLEPNTKYYARSYLTTKSQTVYGNEISFTTDVYVDIATSPIVNITHKNAVSGGKIFAEANIEQKGVCWASFENPTLNDSFTNEGSGSEDFTSNLSDLDSNTDYHVRAYFISEGETVYGKDLTFKTTPNLSTKATLGYKGYFGYLGYDALQSSSHGLGVSFYTAAWELVDTPLDFFQIGLPGTWIIPDNRDNASLALCPPGTLAREWPERGPTWSDVFQTLEGGLGFWGSDRFRDNSPKFNMNATPQCYDYGVESPGWGWGSLAGDTDTALSDNLLSIAQLSNRILIPPDGLTFNGNPNGEFMGYSYMALPLTDAYETSVSIGNQSWTCFINTENFKGPIAYYLPETWAKLSESYPEIEGRGLDSRKGIINGGAMELNRSMHFEALGPDGTFYVKVPKLKFPVNEMGKAPLVQDLIYYNENSIYNAILEWRNGDISSDGTFNESGTYRPSMNNPYNYLTVYELNVQGLDNVFSTYLDTSIFGFTWENSNFDEGYFAEYYKRSGNTMIPIPESEIPEETELVEAEFPIKENGGVFTSPNSGSWSNPGPSSGPHTALINDGSVVTYYWYKFIDQPVFGQYNWSDEKRAALQSLIENIHKEWDITRDYIPPPTIGNLVQIDNNLIVTPPAGMAYGYVPIVVQQGL